MSNLFSRLSLRANIVTVAMAAFFLAACGGDGNKANEPAPSAEADFVVESFGDLSVCTGNREGATAYVKDEDNAYICTNGDWAIDTNADTRKKSSNSKDNTKSSSSRHCEDCKDEAISSSSSAESSSSKVGCKTETEDNCKYGELLDTRDGLTYKTVKIGEQTWMAENLNYKTVISWCGGGYAKSEGDCTRLFGRLYTWAAAIDSVKLATDADNPQDCGYFKTCALPAKVQGVCPPGWHLPDSTEWKTLFAAVGGIDIAGKILRSQTGWKESNGTSGNGTDAYGFSALPAGSRGSNGYFYSGGSGAYFWSATEFNGNSAYIVDLDLYYSSEDVDLNYGDKNYAFSVRCLKDDP